jgi:hypothetical protein
VGAAAGLLLDRARRAGWERRFLVAAGLAGTAGVALGLLFDRGPAVYPRYDFWHTSPSYFHGQYVAPAARSGLPLASAAAGVALLTAAMLALSLARTELPGLTAGATARGLRRAAR